jgi:hypothetical protein
MRGQLHNLADALARGKSPAELAAMLPVTVHLASTDGGGLQKRILAFQQQAPCFRGC